MKISIDQKQITSAEFIKNEVKTLEFLKAQPFVASCFPELSAEADIIHNIYIGRYKKSTPTEFSFGCELKMEIENKNRSLFIEAKVLQDYSPATYALSMCDSDGEQKNLIRKFHFDYDPQSNSSTDKKPKYHLQYGGKATPKLVENDISAEYLHDWLSVPRLSIIPINLALLLDTIFNEFPSEATKKITEESKWREMIKTNEEKILLPYFKNVSQFLNSNHKSNYLFRDFVYGEEYPK
jgi:hypothetical protein